MPPAYFCGALLAMLLWQALCPVGTVLWCTKHRNVLLFLSFLCFQGDALACTRDLLWLFAIRGFSLELRILGVHLCCPIFPTPGQTIATSSL